MSSRYFIGLVVLIVGVTYLLQQIGIVPMNFAATWWPLLIVLYGLNQLVRHPARPTWPILVLVIGALLQISHFRIFPRNLWDLVWAVLLIVIGLRLLFPHHRTVQAVAAKPRDRVDESLNFVTMHYRDDSQQFQGGKVSVSFGNYDLDLRGATLAATGADLEVNASFSTIEVRVPAEWNVLVTGVPFFGSCTNKTHPITAAATTGQPILRVKYAATFGSVEITN